MFADEVVKLGDNAEVDGTYLISDIKLRPFTGKEGNFLTFTLQDKTGLLWAKIWDNAEKIEKLLKNIKIVTIKGRTNLYNDKIQVVVDKIKEAEADYINMEDLVKVSSNGPEEMWEELTKLLDESFLHLDKYREKEENLPYKIIWEMFLSDKEFVKKFKLWPGGKGTVHHAYQHGLLEHTLSVVKTVLSFKPIITFDLDKALLGAFLHDIGKIEAYEYDLLKTEMSNIGRLQEHTTLGYYTFRKMVEQSEIFSATKKIIIEDVGHIILSHHGSEEFHAIVKPMTIEAKLVSIADLMDAEINYMLQQLKTSNEQGWIFDNNLKKQWFYNRPLCKSEPTLKRRKLS